LAARLSEPFPGPTVVLTHHAPSIRSLEPARVSNLLDAAFASDLESLMDGDRVRLWIHGHTHRCVDYAINGTRILSNAAGYPSDPAPGFDPALVIDM
jgi:Icc-related predicted phosphoesterase